MRGFKAFFKTTVGMKSPNECAPRGETKVADEGVYASGGISGLKGAFKTPTPAPPPPPPPAAEPSMSFADRITGGINRRLGR